MNHKTIKIPWAHGPLGPWAHVGPYGPYGPIYSHMSRVRFPIYSHMSRVIPSLLSTLCGLLGTYIPLLFLTPLPLRGVYWFADEPTAFTDVTVGDNKCTEDGCFSSCKGYSASLAHAARTWLQFGRIMNYFILNP